MATTSIEERIFRDLNGSYASPLSGSYASRKLNKYNVKDLNAEPFDKMLKNDVRGYSFKQHGSVEKTTDGKLLLRLEGRILYADAKHLTEAGTASLREIIRANKKPDQKLEARYKAALRWRRQIIRKLAEEVNRLREQLDRNWIRENEKLAAANRNLQAEIRRVRNSNDALMELFDDHLNQMAQTALLAEGIRKRSDKTRKGS